MRCRLLVGPQVDEGVQPVLVHLSPYLRKKQEHGREVRKCECSFAIVSNPEETGKRHTIWEAGRQQGNEQNCESSHLSLPDLALFPWTLAFSTR